MVSSATPPPLPKKKPDVSHSSASSNASGVSSSGYIGNASDETSSLAGTEQQSKTAPIRPNARGHTMIFLGLAAMAGVAIAAATVPKRKVETLDHPLKGSVSRRINMFSHLVQHSKDPTARQPQLGDDGSYVNANEVIV